MHHTPHTPRRPKRLRLLHTATAALALFSLGAQAQMLMQPGPRSDLSDADTLEWRAGAQWQRDDNVFLEPEGQTKTDNMVVTTVGLRVNKPYSLQRLELDVSLDNHQYDRYSALDFTALNYNGAFRWAFTPKLRGNLTAERRENTDRFSDVSNNQVNRRTEQAHGLDAEYEVGAAWRALAGVFERRSENTLSTLEPDATVRGAELGARYEFRSGNALAYRYRQGQGEYAGGVGPGGDFSDRQHELELDWRATGQVRVGGRLGWLEREHDTLAARDFSGWMGRLNANWQATGKTSVAAGLVRELASYVSDFGTHYEGTRLFVAPQWKPTVKTAVRLHLEHGMRTYKGAASALNSGREDSLSRLALGLEWEPIRALRLLATVQRDQRDTNRNGLDYKANMVGLSAVVSF
jgi:exopolysaccharide biosynthesis operon protein EpsL